MALGSCRSHAPATVSSQTKQPQQVKPAARVEGRAAAVVVRVPAKGGPPRLYRLPGLAELPGALRGKVPGAERVFGVDVPDGQLYFRTAKKEVLAYDLESGRTDTVAVGVEIAAIGPDGTLFTVDGKRHIVTYVRRSRSSWSQSLAMVPWALFGAADQRLIAVLAQSPTKLVTVAPSQPPVTRPFGGAANVDVARWGDAAAAATDSGVLLADPFGRRPMVFIALPDHPTNVTFSPAGHRIYVVRKSALGLAVLDRFSHQEMDGIALPGPAAAVRIDPLGRWLLARPVSGDSMWVVDLPTKVFVGVVHGSWDADLPTVAPDGTLLVRQGADVVALRPDSLKELGRIAGGASDLWTATEWLPRGATRSAALADAPSPAAASGDTAAGILYVQVSISQNQSWSEGMAQQLTRAGLAARVLPPTSGDDGFRVVLGPYPTREQAEDIGKKLGRPFWIYEPGQ